MQLYRYLVSQSSEFCRYNECYCCCLFRYRLSPETFGYTRVKPFSDGNVEPHHTRRSPVKYSCNWATENQDFIAKLKRTEKR